MGSNFIHFIICFAFYIVGAYATTDILRLLKGCSISVNAPDCYCPICHNKIALKDQLPIFSYFKNHGGCFHCKSPIPMSDLFLEIFLFITLSDISLLLNFSWIAYFLCVFVYQSTKIVFLLIYGQRETDFLRNLLLSTCNNILIFSLIAVFFLLSNIL